MLKLFTKQKKPAVYAGPVRKYYDPKPCELNYLSDSILNSPHTLIAGTTGSGKSVLLNTLLNDFISSKGVSNRLFLIDPKRVELSIYKNLPHVIEYTSDSARAVDILAWVIDIIEDRYKSMEKAGIRQYTGGHIYVIIDELADLMISPQNKQFKLNLQKILQIGRAANIHVIAATQAPNRKIIDSNIVLNFTNRVALRCLTAIESRQVINQSGAETLPKHGYCMYLEPGEAVKLVPVHMVPDHVIQNNINTWTNGSMLIK